MPLDYMNLGMEFKFVCYNFSHYEINPKYSLPTLHSVPP